MQEHKCHKPQTQANIFIYFLDHEHKAPFADMKMEHQRSGTQFVAMVTKLVSSHCEAHLVESYCNEANISDTTWLRYLFSSYLIKIRLTV